MARVEEALGPMIGQRLGHYHIFEGIGEGGMGVVYRARDERLERDVALKVLPSGALDDEAARKRFRKEALALAKLNHPNIATIYDFDTQDGVDFLVMEYVSGQSLAERLRVGSLGEKEISALGGQIAAALQEAHEQGIIHRDLKPGNILVTPKGKAKVLDFGLAKLLGAQGDAEVAQTLTETQDVAGTLPYMAPEQLRGEGVDARTDIYALGCVLYEMTTGQRPFDQKLATALADEILHKPPSALKRVKPGTSSRLEAIILKCLDKEPGRRYHSATELRVDLERLSVQKGRMQAASSKANRRAIHSVAVLPLENSSGEADAEYLSDGITESVISNLSQVPNLRVMARSMVFRYKGQSVDAKTVGRELNVGAVLTGRLVQRGDTLNIGVELMDVAEGWQLWGGQYNRKMADILAIQEEISREISEKLHVRLTEDQRKRLVKRPTKNSEAYQLYLKGRYCWNKWTEESNARAIGYYQDALRADPRYALAYAGLADAYASWGDQAGLPPREAIPRAKDCALRALELDDSLAEAHTVLGLIHFTYDWDWAAAEREFKRSLSLNPNSETTHHWYSHLLGALSKNEKSLKMSLRGLELAPLDLEMNAHLAWHYIFAREYERAIEQCRKTMELDPNFHESYWFQGWAYALVGKLNESIEALQRAVTLSGKLANMNCFLAYAYAWAGNRSKAEEILQELDRVSRRRYVSAYRIAAIHLALGDQERAFEWFEKAYEERTGWMAYFAVDPLLDAARSDPRHAEMVRRLRL
jgi:serine/threonine protein kinase/tetratricopeptide (TPR) repeat protein